MKKAFYILSVFLLSGLFQSISSFGQIVVTPNLSASILANNLVGSGITIMSPTLTCPGIANGTFVGPSSLSFNAGIVLTSGRAATVGATTGSNGPASGFASTSNAAPGDPQLTALAGQPTFDACILEFDFKTSGDTVKFNYVFGSEEYNGYTCSSFNDVFGFFISGPTYGGPTNIALIPGTTIPVCINSVNCSTGAVCTALVGPGAPYCSYYVNNLAGTTISYDGLTATLQAIAPVTPCDTYHLKIGIADGTDHIFDSGVFLEAGSFSSTAVSVSPLGINSTDTTYGGQYCVRGCVPGQFVFHTSVPVTSPFVIHFVTGGTAVMGTDYTSIADSVVIPAGGTSGTVYINGLPVVPAGGPRTVILYILSPLNCGGATTIIDSAILNILDSFYVHIITPDTSICEGQSVHIMTTGDTTLVYSWLPSSTLNSNTLLSPTATPLTTTTYTVSGVYPSAGCLPSTDVITITVIHPISLNVGPPVQSTCLSIPLQLNVAVTPPGGSYTYSWSPVTDLDNAAIPNPVVTPTTIGDFPYSVTVTETTAGCSSIASFTLHVLPNDFSLFNPDSTMCFNGIVQIRASGDTEFSYHWTPAATVSNPYILTPIAYVNSTTHYVVTGSYPGCPDMVHTLNLSIEAPNVDILTRDTAFCINDSIPVKVRVTPADSPYTYLWTPTTYFVNPSVLEPVFTSSVVGDYHYTLTIQSSIGCTSSDSVILSPRPLAHIMATPGTTTINYGDHIQLDAINLTAYPLIFWWRPDDGTLDLPNINNPIATPLDSTNYIVYAMNEWGCRDSANVIILVNDGMGEGVPTAFTPNGDGLNDVFRLTNLRYQKLVEFSIYNRWGQLVYHNTSDIKKGWDGTLNGVEQDMGVYSYFVIIARPDGGQKIYKGDFTLIR